MLLFKICLASLIVRSFHEDTIELYDPALFVVRAERPTTT